MVVEGQYIKYWWNSLDTSNLDWSSFFWHLSGPQWLHVHDETDIHYENIPIQIYGKFHLQKLKIFR